MRCTICCAVFGLLVSSGAVFPQTHAVPRTLARPRVKVVGVRWFGPRPPMFIPCFVPVPFPYPVPDPVPYPVWNFITIEEGGTKSVPHTVPFGDLDVQRTTNTNAAQGFRFVVRDEPIEQWLEHRSQRAPQRHPRNN